MSARRSAIGLVFVVLALLIILPPMFGWFRDDYTRFDRKSFTVESAVDGDTLILADGRATRVALLGVDAPDFPDAHFSEQAMRYLDDRLRGRRILLRLDGTQTRDDAGRLLAYVYLGDTDLVNADIVRDGLAYADRRSRHTFAPQIEQLENEARTRKRGLWENVTDEQQPAWRREWLKSRGG